jgi:hypothetical protein
MYKIIDEIFKTSKTDTATAKSVLSNESKEWIIRNGKRF